MSFNAANSGQNFNESTAGLSKIISGRFTDVEQFTEFLTYSQMEIIQLSRGSFQSEFLATQIGDLYFTRISANQSVQASGPKHQGYINFELVWAAKGGNFYAHGQPLCPQTDLNGFDRQRETGFVTPQVGMMVDIFIPVGIFEACANHLQRYDLDDRFLAKNHVSILPDWIGQIKDYLRELFWLAQHQPDWLNQPHVQQLVANDLVPLVIQAIPIQGSSTPTLKPSRRRKLIAQAEQEIVAHLEKPLTLKELAKRLGSSSSALSYGFQELFAMSPMRYLKVRRLNAVRRCLKASDPDSCSVEALANQFGFWNAGHFARDYRLMFGELPSKTLQRKAVRQ
ncbi:helix-turn-helix domain-containing protein [Moorena producens JHB]|uniref:Helix-turn-helix domain-containing protein n=1 Tax=Moorena producens (strain JHB) TaxID=1454205 RepID=A0A1D9GB44_MOOP1|nr:helix-turn-helix domain-containing protein [Moorena producens]AOY84600.2 helix-turn-helix domain-containing protein [Moorena producens JHB]